MTTMDDCVALYVETRDKIKALEAEHKAQLAPYREVLVEAERLIMTLLNDTGAESMKTAHGTAYKASWTKASVRDWQAVLDYAVENERYDLFERRVSKQVVEELGEVPGVEMERGVRVNVRRS